MAGYGLTDLERGKYLPGGTNVSSTVRVSQSGPIPGIASTVATSPVNYSVIPKELFNYKIKYFETGGGNRNQNIDGSVTPVEFKIIPTVRTLIKVFTVTSTAVNVQSITDYGNISGGLTNGIYFYSTVGAIETELINIKRWVEFTHATSVGSLNLSLKGNATEDTMSATLVLEAPLLIEPGKELRIRVRDNLSGIKYQTATAVISEVP
jgi:hypothetical protein